MKIQIVSDLHLEWSTIDILNSENADVLVLSGDIMVAETMHDKPAPNSYNFNEPEQYTNDMSTAQKFRLFLKNCSLNFPHVVYVAGNHEFYNGRWVASIQHMRDECLPFSNIHFLECDSVVIDDVTFVGGTLWTDMNKKDPMTLHAIRDMMNDFRKIRRDDLGFVRLKPADVVMRHDKTLEYINTVVSADTNKKYVVVGHHAPSHLSIHEYYKDETIMNGGYTSDLSNFILDRPQIKLWTHGHMHTPFDYLIGTTRIVCNPRGYESEMHIENPDFNPNFIVEL